MGVLKNSHGNSEHKNLKPQCRKSSLLKNQHVNKALVLKKVQHLYRTRLIDQRLRRATIYRHWNILGGLDYIKEEYCK